MKLRLIFSLLALLPLGLYAQTPREAAPLPAQQSVVALPMDDEALASLLQNILLADVAGLAETAPDDTETAQEQAREAVEAYLAAMQKAYKAQLAFAEHSLGAVAELYPEQHVGTLTMYRRKLQLAYLQELALVRSCAELWISPARRPQQVLRQNAFANALRVRANATAPNMIALREFHSHAPELARQQLELKRQYLLRHLSAGFDSLPPSHEFLSCLPLQDFAPAEYISARARLFSEAEALWEAYATCVARLVCPVRSMQGAQGNNTFADEQLLYSHEEWLTELLSPMR